MILIPLRAPSSSEEAFRRLEVPAGFQQASRARVTIGAPGHQWGRIPKGERKVDHGGVEIFVSLSGLVQILVQGGESGWVSRWGCLLEWATGTEPFQQPVIQEPGTRLIGEGIHSKENGHITVFRNLSAD